MKTAGVVLDFYDDPQGRVLKETFPNASGLPDAVKEAHFLSEAERDVLRDEAYALVLVNEGKVLRKFACVDAGNTALSALYFMKTHESLPPEAVKVAAVNLADACEEFDLPGADTLMKIAASNHQILARHIGGGALVGGGIGGHDRYDRSTKKPGESDKRFKYRRLRQTAVGAASGGAKGAVIGGITGSLHNAHRDKKGLDDLVHTIRGTKVPNFNDIAFGKKASANGAARKRDSMSQPAAVGDDADWAARTNLRSVQGGDNSKVLSTTSNTKTASRIVDVTGKEPERILQKKASTHTALNGTYSLDSYSDVQKAVEYFTENWTEMDPGDRHEYAVKTASRAGSLGIEVPDLLARYGSTGYAPDVEAHLANRRAFAPEWSDVYTELQEKRASIEPEEFALVLEEADRASGLAMHWGGRVCDPFLATFGGGFAKEASIWSWMSRTGEFVSGDQLHELALNGRPLIHKHFSSDVTNGFIANPIPIFESLPDTHKIIIARLASDMNDGLALN